MLSKREILEKSIRKHREFPIKRFLLWVYVTFEGRLTQGVF